MAALTLKEGKLYRYGSGLLSFKKGWKQCYAVLSSDSILKLYKDQNLTKELAELNLDALVLWLTFGKDAEKFQPPKPSSSDDADILSAVVETKSFIAVPKDKTRDNIVWLAAENQNSLRSWIRAIALSVKDKSKPPVLGSKRGDYSKLIEQIQRHFDIKDVADAEDWEIYWLYSIIGVDLSNFQEDPAGPEVENGVNILRRIRSNMSDDDNSDPEGIISSDPYRKSLIEELGYVDILIEQQNKDFEENDKDFHENDKSFDQKNKTFVEVHKNFDEKRENFANFEETKKIFNEIDKTFDEIYPTEIKIVILRKFDDGLIENEKEYQEEILRRKRLEKEKFDEILRQKQLENEKFASFSPKTEEKSTENEKESLILTENKEKFQFSPTPVGEIQQLQLNEEKSTQKTKITFTTYLEIPIGASPRHF